MPRDATFATARLRHAADITISLDIFHERQRHFLRHDADEAAPLLPPRAAAADY